MVSTRHHPRDFPPPDLSPTKERSPRKSRTSTASPAPDSSSPSTSPSTATSTSQSLAKLAMSNTINVAPAPPASTGRRWSHTASNLTLAWLSVSIPLVFWDSLYILLRPHTFPGGKLAWPIWTPYEIYARADLVYSPQAWEAGEGFGGAQGALNAVELVLYGVYAMVLWRHGVSVQEGGMTAGIEGRKGWLKGGRRVEGWRGNRAVLIGFAASVMTLSKTVLYYFNEYFSGFANIKHNDWITIIGLYGIMNGLWVLFPAYMTTVFATDILTGLDHAAESTPAKKKL